MSSLPTGHVGDLAASLVDDQLDPVMRDLVLRHMIGCVTCRREVAGQRQLKARLAALSEPGLPSSLSSRLNALDQVPPGAPAGRSAFVRDSRRGRRLLAGAASLLLVAAGTAYAADGQPGTPAQPAANTPGTSTIGQTGTISQTSTIGQTGTTTESRPLKNSAFLAMTTSFGR